MQRGKIRYAIFIRFRNYERHATRVSHSYRGSRQGLVQARTLARCSRKKSLALPDYWRDEAIISSRGTTLISD